MNNFKNFESFKVENDKAVNGGWFSFGSYGGWGGNTYSGWGSASAVGNGGAGGAGGASGSISITTHQPVYQQPVYQQPVYQQPVHQPVQQTFDWGGWAQSLVSNFWWCI